MGRLYSATFEDIAVTAVQDLFHLAAAANKAIVLHSLTLSQVTKLTSEILQVKISRTGAAGSGGGAVTPAPLDPTDAAAGSTVRRNDTTQSTTTTLLHVDGWNVVNPYVWMPTPEARIVVAGGANCCVELETAPGASMTMSGELVFEEIG